MLVNKMLMNVTEILLVIFAIFLFSCYFSIFFTRRKKKITIVIGYTIFAVWQLMLLNASMQILLERYAYSEISGTSILI